MSAISISGLLARSTARRAEIAVRLAIGAGRAPLIRQLLTESVLLSVIRGGLGSVFAFSLSKFLFGFLPQATTRIVLDVWPDLVSAAFTLVVSVLTGILFGISPALQTANDDFVVAITGGQSGAGGGGLKLGKTLIVAEVALSLVLLIVAGMFVRTFQNLKRMRGRFEEENVLLFTMKPVHEGYSSDRMRQFCSVDSAGRGSTRRARRRSFGKRRALEPTGGQRADSYSEHEVRRWRRSDGHRRSGESGIFRGPGCSLHLGL